MCYLCFRSFSLVTLISKRNYKIWSKLFNISRPSGKYIVIKNCVLKLNWSTKIENRFDLQTIFHSMTEWGDVLIKMSKRVIPIRGDGNCLFRSISYCVYGTQERHREIRNLVVDNIVANWYRYKDFIVGDRSYVYEIRNATDYSRIMSRDGEFAGHAELHCVSELFKEYTFKVHRLGCSRTTDYGRGMITKHLLFSGYMDAGHYSVLEFY